MSEAVASEAVLALLNVWLNVSHCNHRSYYDSSLCVTYHAGRVAGSQHDLSTSSERQASTSSSKHGAQPLAYLDDGRRGKPRPQPSHIPALHATHRKGLLIDANDSGERDAGT